MKGDKARLTFSRSRAFFVAMAKDREPEKEKSEYQKIIDGEIDPIGCQKGWSNLQPEKYNFAVMDEEKRREISRKGAEAVNRIKGEKRSAKEALENILTLRATDAIIDKSDLDPELAERLKRSGIDITMYDLLQLVAVGRAAGGNMKAYELIRDTYGDAPIKQLEVTQNVTTEQDRELLQTIAKRLQDAETVQIVESVNTELQSVNTDIIDPDKGKP